MGGRVSIKADDDASRGVPFGDLLKRANLRMIAGDGHSAATFKQVNSKFSLNSFGALRRGHLAARNCPAARQPCCHRNGRRADHQHAGRPQPDRRGRRHGNWDGADGTHVVRLPERRTDQQQLRRLRGPCPCGRAPLEVHFLDYPDKEANPLGARGIGEIGLAGVAAAITDAVHHATGVRVRELPVKIEDLL